ncbi:MAG: ABC transporter permease [Oscillospiraceae bacterium]|nr:ABC transporter permease [Oscillospiraceae bacterium]
MAEKLTSGRLALLNLRQRAYRTAGLGLIVALLAFVLFGGSILTISLNNGLSSLNARFGADLVVVPLGYDGDMEAILLKGEPSYFYLDASVVDDLREIKGVEAVSSQFYLTSTGAACCDLPVQIIGIDPETDFTVTPWIDHIYDTLSDGALIIGSDVQAQSDGTIRFYGHKYRIAATLDETGTGMDQSIFANRNTVLDLMEAAKEQGYNFIDSSDPERLVSSIFIKTAEGYDAETVTHNIRVAIDGLQVIKTKSMVTGIAESIQSIVSIVYVFIAVFLALSIVIQTTVFTVTANERKREFAVLRTLGATRKKLAGILLEEALYISTAGGVLGVALAAGVVFPFSVYIGDRLGLPYVVPSTPTVLVVLAVSLFITILLGPLSAAYAAAKISRADTYRILREGE